MSNSDLQAAPVIEDIAPVECHMASTIEDQMGRLEVVTERYELEHYLDGIGTVSMEDISPDILLSKEGFDILRGRLSSEEDESFMKDGILVEHDGKKLYLDKYNWNSVPFVVKRGEEYLGSARLIIKNGFGLPTTNDPRIEISNLWKEKATQCTAEFSQFAVKKGAPMDSSVKLLKAAYDYSNYAGIENWVATTDNSVVRLLNSSFFKFDLPYIGPSVDYLGSASTPIFIDLEKALDNASKFESSRRIATFIRGH
jgi:hypothetical protein